MYYDLSDHALYICSGTTLKWVAVGGGGGGWSLTGNAGTIAGTNFIGTTDAIDWVVKTNNAERLRITSGGNIGINTASPSSGTGGQLKFDVEGLVGATKYCDQNGNNCTVNGNIQQRVTGTCTSSQAIRVINADGTVTCVNLPSSALCTWGSLTYSTGAKCCHPAQVYVCQANGTWDQLFGASCSVLTCGQ